MARASLYAIVATISSMLAVRVMVEPDGVAEPEHRRSGRAALASQRTDRAPGDRRWIIEHRDGNAALGRSQGRERGANGDQHAPAAI